MCRSPCLIRNSVYSKEFILVFTVGIIEIEYLYFEILETLNAKPKPAKQNSIAWFKFC